MIGRMTYRQLVISLCAHLAMACVPMRPGEDLPCPAVPQASTAPGYVTSAMKSRSENGAKVYHCKSPQRLLAVDGATVNELPAETMILCKPNSGMYVRGDGKKTGKEKYTCGIKEKPCTPLSDYTGGPIGGGVEHTALPTPTKTMRDTIWKCPAPMKLYKVQDQDPAKAILVGDSSVVCNRQTGKLSVTPGDTPVDPATESYVCGITACQKCGTTKIVDKSNAACKAQTGMYCHSKPTIGDNNGCPTLTCDAQPLYVMTSSTASKVVISAATVECDNGDWKYDGNTLAAGDAGFVCAKPATCVQCTQLANDVFTPGTQMFETPTPPDMKPTCAFTCPPNHLLVVNNKPHERVLCHMETEKLTVDVVNGEALSATNKFSCDECKCMTTQLTDGLAGLCPFGSLCGHPRPTPTKDMCEAKCPPDSSPIYLDAAKTLKMATSITCNGADWITAGKDDAAGVTCQFKPDKGYLTAPPTSNAQCPPLTVITTCPATSCDAALLIYVEDNKGGVYATCKNGGLVTNVVTGELVASCIAGVGWSQGVAEATCATDPTIVADCLNELPAATLPMVDFECKYGICQLSCKNGKQFQYDLNGNIETNKHMKCYQGEPYTVDLQYPTASTIMCV